MYELFYSYGGHGGPYWSMRAAVRAAFRRLRGSTSPALTFISIVTRDNSIGGYGQIVRKIQKEEVQK